MPAILTLGVRGPVPHKEEGPSRCGNLPTNSADFDDKEGLDPNGSCLFAAGSPTDTVGSQNFQTFSTRLLVAERPMPTLQHRLSVSVCRRYLSWPHWQWNRYGQRRPIQCNTKSWRLMRRSNNNNNIRKVMDRLIANRLSWWFEEHSALTPYQASLRKGRSTTDQCKGRNTTDQCKGRNTTDQCMRQSQFISEGFQPTQRRRNIATFFEFCRAYDRVWRTELLMKMSKMDVPSRFTEWLSSWFICRTARLWENGSIRPSISFKEGRP